MKTLEKEFAEVTIFNSILKNLSLGLYAEGLEGLTTPLKIVPLTRYEISFGFDIREDSSDYVYLQYLDGESIPVEYTSTLADFDIYSTSEYQMKWFKDYIKNPNKVVKILLKDLIGKLGLNKKLAQIIGYELIDYMKDSLQKDTRPYKYTKTPKFNEHFNKDCFQDLVYLTLYSTVYNAQKEIELCENFYVANKNFWECFYTLYENVFLTRYGRSQIFDDSYFYSEKMKEDIKLLGFEVLEYSLLSKKYIEYPQKFQPYLKVISNQFFITREQNLEYLKYKEKSQNLYLELCKKYNIDMQ